MPSSTALAARYRRCLRLRALRCRGPHARRTRGAQSASLRGDAARAGDVRRRRPRLPRRRRRRPEDGLLPRPARQSRARCARLRRAARCSTCSATRGGFTLAALAGGAHGVTSLDSSGSALRRGAREPRRAIRRSTASARSGWRPTPSPTLRKFRDAARAFDLIVLDPPKFAPTAAHAERASRAYKDINLLGAQAAAPGRAAGDLFVLGRDRRRALPQDRRRRRARRRRRRHGRRARSARVPTIRSRWRFPKAITSRAC